MKTNRYTFAVVFFLTAALFFSTGSFAQRYGYRHDRGRYYNYYPHRSYYYNQPYVSIAFGNIFYRYQAGYFYRPYGATFQIALPPFGIRIGALPYGYRSFYVGPDPYYYYNGIYYRPYRNQYEVVAPPLGAVVDELPAGAKVTVIDGKKYYELDGTFYEETITPNSDLKYTVVGTDGVLNTGDANNNANTPAGPAIGDKTDTLPADSKAVVINGQKLYAAPSGFYYKEVIEGNKVHYEIVGK
ncbi:MAG: DUF6515 family protein [Bacteroidota bacterium]|nr:DUF6515 family protein [Bacteroidota bacterium]